MAVESREAARAHLADAGLDELPNDWDVASLGDLLADDRGIAVGVMYPGEHDPAGVPLIKAGDLNGSVINPDPEFRISQEKHDEYRRTALEGGELLMTLVGNVGQCAVVPPRMAGWNTARAVAVMRLKDQSDTHFVQQCLLSRPLQHLMDVWCNTTVQATLNLKEIRQLPIPWPSKQSRDAIAAIGKALDDKIELNRRMNATLEAMARALFQSWFVDFDPVRAKLDGREPVGMDAETAALFPVAFQDSPLGQIPAGWEIKTADDISEVGIGKTPPRKEQQWFSKKSTDVPWMSIRDLGNSAVFISQTSEFLTAEAVERFRVRRIPDDTVVLSFKLTMGRVAITDGEMLSNEAIAHFLLNPRTPFGSAYLYCYLKNFGYDQLGSTSSIATAINSDMVRAIKVLVPSEGVGNAFQEMVGPLFAQMKVIQRQSRTLAALRDTLLPKLLSGELRVASR
jgi:type I restriction enzyme S subunit